MSQINHTSKELCVPKGVTFALECLRRVVIQNLGSDIWLGHHKLVVQPEKETSVGRSRAVRFKGEFNQDSAQGFEVSARMIAERKHDKAWDSCVVYGHLFPDDQFLVTRRFDDQSCQFSWTVKDVTPDTVQEFDEDGL